VVAVSEQTYRLDEVELPMPPHTLIQVGMNADVEDHGDRLPIEGISVTFCPSRDAAAEGNEVVVDTEDGERTGSTAAEVVAIEASLLPFAVFDLGKAGWCYGRQIKAVHEAEV